MPKDDEEAARWYRKAAEAGRAQAAFNLGWMLRDGRGVPRDPAEAALILRAAAEGGLAPARLPLAELLLEAGDGDGAVPLLRLAAEGPDGTEAKARPRVLGAWEPGGVAATR